MTPSQLFLLQLIITNLIRQAFERVSDMTPEQVEREIAREESRFEELTARLKG